MTASTNPKTDEPFEVEHEPEHEKESSHSPVAEDSKIYEIFGIVSD
jgi:hypothetical protein